VNEHKRWPVLVGQVCCCQNRTATTVEVVPDNSSTSNLVMQVWAIIYDKANFPDSVCIPISQLIEQNRHMSSSFIIMLYP